VRKTKTSFSARRSLTAGRLLCLIHSKATAPICKRLATQCLPVSWAKLRRRDSRLPAAIRQAPAPPHCRCIWCTPPPWAARLPPSANFRRLSLPRPSAAVSPRRAVGILRAGRMSAVRFSNMDYAVCCFRVLVLLPSGFARDLRRLGGIVSFSEVKHRMNICFSGIWSLFQDARLCHWPWSCCSPGPLTGAKTDCTLTFAVPRGQPWSLLQWIDEVRYAEIMRCARAFTGVRSIFHPITWWWYCQDKNIAV